MFDELPRGVLESSRSRSALVDRNTFDRLVESHVRFFPVEHPDEVIA